MTDTVQIPLAVFDADAFQSLPWGAMRALIALYTRHDADRFTIACDRPQDYGLSAGISLYRRVKQLTDAGLLVQDGWHVFADGNRQRVFRFQYPAFELTKEAA
jgi:hypothetical protein